MELDERALPLTRGQLDIWLAEETGVFGARWQLGLFARIAGPIDPDLFESAIRQAVSEAEPLRASPSIRSSRSATSSSTFHTTA